MAVSKVLTLFMVITIACVNGDFFADLDKLDIDSKLREIGKAINSVDNGDESVLNQVKPKKKENDAPTLGSAVEMLADMFGGECKYHCKNGNRPTPKAEHVPTSNGCGSNDIQIDTANIPGVEDCCDKHDYCYDTCNSDRATCDKEFKECLHNTCKKTKTSNKKKVSYKDCMAAADLMYSGTVALGCDSFLKAQENACSCSKTRKPTSEQTRNTAKRDNKVKKSTTGRRSDEL